MFPVSHQLSRPSSTTTGIGHAASPVQSNLANLQSLAQQFGNLSTGNTNALFNQLLPLMIQLVQQLLVQFQQQSSPSAPDRDYQSIDGTGNNQQRPDLGATNQQYQRILTSDPGRAPGGVTEAQLPNARTISNAVSAQTESTANQKGLSDMFWIWGQFLDHDITLSAEGHGDTANITVPQGDPWFDPRGTGTATIPFTRSQQVVGADGQNYQLNQITSFIDGSNVYGADKQTADSLREFAGGRLIANEAGMMPKDDKGHYLAGDKRANENAGLTSMHTLWVREHNRVADALAQQHPDWNDQQLYQEARSLVVAEMQAITYNEFLPGLLGEQGLSAYQGYNPEANPNISSAFASAAYRFGHSMISPTLLRLDENGQEIEQGNLGLRDAFFQPHRVSEAGIDPILRGLSAQTAQEADTLVIDDLRNFLFGPPGAGGMDLVALNIQRGRDHELPGYNDARTQLGLPRIESFDDPIWKEGVGAKLAQIYQSPDEVDLWVAGLAEKPVGDSLVGQTNSLVLAKQFEALRDGDRFWYENQFDPATVNALNNLSLSDVIKRNTGIQNMQDQAMKASNIHLA